MILIVRNIPAIRGNLQIALSFSAKQGNFGLFQGNNVRIIVAEYPKSGGSWLCNLLGELLQIPARDIYVNADNPAPHIVTHPWYKNGNEFGLISSCVIKSHEKFGSQLHDFEHLTVHLVRDGRDVVVSKFHFEKDFCVLNGFSENFDIPFNVFLLKTALEWVEYIHSWRGKHQVICTYENLIENPVQTIQKLGHDLGLNFSQDHIVSALEKHSKENMRASLSMFKGDFVRKGIVGDWKNLFDETSKHIFKKHAGNLLVELGYEKDLKW